VELVPRETLWSVATRVTVPLPDVARLELELRVRSPLVVLVFPVPLLSVREMLPPPASIAMPLAIEIAAVPVERPALTTPLAAVLFATTVKFAPPVVTLEEIVTLLPALNVRFPVVKLRADEAATEISLLAWRTTFVPKLRAVVIKLGKIVTLAKEASA
jgi:hypothetical protein